MKRLFLLRWVAGAAILAFVLSQTNVSELDDAFSQVGPEVWLAVLALNIPVLLLATLRSRLALSRLGHRVQPRILVSTVTLGFVAGSMTPGASGELLRTEALNASAGIARRDGLALVVFERLLSFYLLVLTGLVLAALLLLPFEAAAIVTALALVALPAPALAGFFLRLIPPVGEEPSSLSQRVLYFVRITLARLTVLVDDRPLLAMWSLVTLATFAVIGVQFWLLADAVAGGVLTYPESLFAFSGSQVMAIISLLPLGLGIADGSIVEISARSGMTRDQGVALAVLVRATITLPLIVLGTASYVYLMLQRQSLGIADVEAARSQGRAEEP